MKYPPVLVNYRFTGFLDEIYATLVVRLHHTEPFQQDQLWCYASDFKTNTGKQLGVKLTRRAPGVAALSFTGAGPCSALPIRTLAGRQSARRRS